MTVPSDPFNISSSYTNSVENTTNHFCAHSSSTVLSNSNQRNSSSVNSLEDGDSSIAESDSDCDENIITNCEQNDKYILERRANSVSVLKDVQPTIVVANQRLGSVAIQNSADITFGNKTFYHGPVTIKQFLLDDHTEWHQTGNDNPAYIHSNGARGGDASVAPNAGTVIRVLLTPAVSQQKNYFDFIVLEHVTENIATNCQDTKINKVFGWTWTRKLKVICMFVALSIFGVVAMAVLFSLSENGEEGKLLYLLAM